MVIVKAKDMFEEINFKLIENYTSNIIHYERYYYDDTFEELEIIEFCLKDLSISMARKIKCKIDDSVSYGAFNNIDMDLLQAINQQMKEIGVEE